MSVTGLQRHNVSVSGEKLLKLCQKYQIQRLALFGSILRDDFTPESDVDLLVEFAPGHTPGLGFIEIQDELSRLLGRSVDLNTPQDLSRYFRQQVLEQAEVIYAAES